jgi:hypothetical protein
MLKKLQLSNPNFGHLIPKIMVLILSISGILILIWIGYLTWNDISYWQKGLDTILFGSRTGENIGLGIGMLVVHYYLIGISLFISGLILNFKNRIPKIGMKNPIQRNPQKMVHEKRNGKSSPLVELKTKESGVIAEERFFSGCLNYFGYLSSRPKDSPIPQECIICQRLGDCMVATVYAEKTN